ncbi:MAG: prepilin peptidase [Phycisphaerales bacterium]|nr:prepilin peptidase [Phycisphaerales bacterium]
MTCALVDPQLLLHIPVLAFVFAFGCCVGSFINVLVYRLPRGMSVVRPASRCPSCETKLTWRENFPVLGWIALGGRCRFCRAKISIEYPIVELVVGLLLASLFVLYYMVPTDAVVLGSRAPEWATARGVGWLGSWPMFVAHAVLIASLVAMTLIDARHFIIPLEIPWVVTIVGLIANVTETFTHNRLTAWHGWDDPGRWALVPATSWMWLAVALAGCAGLAIGIMLLKAGLLRHSFEDYDEWEQQERARVATERGEDDEAASSVPAEAEQAHAPARPMDLADDGAFDPAAYPHVRREMVRELLFLAPCLGLMMLAWQVGTRLGWSGEPPAWLMAVGGSMLGYLVGGGAVWGTRILGSLAFDKEAMGLGDVHMMAAVGAVLGWVDPILTFFFAAPFLGIAYAVGILGPARLFTSMRKPLPYGPFLALGIIIVMLAKPEYEQLLSTLLHRTVNLP